MANTDIKRPVSSGLTVLTDDITGVEPQASAEAQSAVIETVNTGSQAKCTLVILLPLYYNPTNDGVRKAVETEKIQKTEAEIRRRFSRYHWSQVVGWYRDESTGEEFVDDLLRFEIDDVFDQPKRHFLKIWRQVLETRFSQREIYFKLSAPITHW